MTFRILSSDNGVGLTRDRWIIQLLLESHGHSVIYRHWDEKPPRGEQKVDGNIFLELINPAWFWLGKRNFIIPNPEWYQRRWISKSIFSQVIVLCKTRDTERIFNELGCKTHHISFTSEDRKDNRFEKLPTFVHLPGKSDAKGTDQVIRAFAQEGMPRLDIYCDPRKQWKALSENVFIHRVRLDEQHFIKVQNENLFHLCPSAYEGFGHYINEAKSSGAVVITTAAEPMTDLVTQQFGIGIAPSSYSLSHLALLKHPSVEGIVKAVKLCEQVGVNARGLGKRARDSYLQNDVYFRENFIQVVTN